MKKLIFLIFIIAIFSCKKKENKFPVLNPDPLITSYKKNNVSYYLKINYFKDSIFNKDSVAINSDGFITDKITLKGLKDQIHYEFDSINRVIITKLDSDIHSHFRSNYKVHLSNNEVVEFLYTYQWGTYQKLTDDIVHYKFDNKMRLLKEKIFISLKDTITHTLYNYNKLGKVTKILKKNILDGYQTETIYKYDKDSILKEIIGDGEVKYISSKTGLIDSIKEKFPRSKTYYQYYFRKRVQK